MDIEWDEVKRQQILMDRGVDLLWAALIFEGSTLTKQDTRHDYGEQRFVSLGLVDDVPDIVIYTWRGETMRLITAWKGGQRDYERYKERIP